MTHYTGHGSFVESGAFTFEGKDFIATGSYLDSTKGIARGYLKLDDHAHRLVTWDGKLILGTAKVVARWRIKSYMTDRMYQVECVIQGRTYTGRSMGNGMVWNGKLKKA